MRVLLLVLFLAGCADAPPFRTFPGPQVAVVARGLHADIGVPAARLPQLGAGAEWLIVGFGDRDYYLSPSGKFSGALAALWPGPGALLVTALNTRPEEAFGKDKVVYLPMSQEQSERIAAYLWNSFSLRDGKPVRLGDGPYPGSAYYKSDRIYALFDNCNRWVADGLVEGGVPIDPQGIIFAGQVMGRLSGRGEPFRPSTRPSNPAAR